MAINISLAAEPVLHLGPVAINNSLLAGILGSAIVFTLFKVAANNIALVPKGRLSLIIDTICDAILNLIDQVTGNRAKSIRFFPILTTLFFFIVINSFCLAR